MWNYYRKSMLCVYYYYILQLYFFAHAGELHTRSRQIEAQIGDHVGISCVGTLGAGDSLVFSIHGVTAYLVSTVSVDDPAQISLYRGTAGVIDVSFGEISPDATLRVNISMAINSVGRESDGEYLCLYTGVEQLDALIELELVGPPYDVHISSQSKGVELDKLTVFDRNNYPTSQALWRAKVDIDVLDPFEIDGIVMARPDATITWSKNDYRYESSKIDVERSEDDLDGSEFFCSAVNSYGSYNITMIVESQYKPREPVVINRNMYPEEGKQLIAECRFDAKPEATIFYVKVEEDTNQWNRSNATNQDGKLIINDVELIRDIGRYLCVADNKLGRNTGEIFIHGKPKDVDMVTMGVYGDSIDITLKTYSAIPVEFELYVNSTDQDNTDRSVQQVIDKRVYQTTPRIRVDHELTGLEPLTSYSIQLKAWSRHGVAWSQSYNISTAAADVKRPVKPKITEIPGDTTDNDKENGATSPVCSVLSILLSLSTLLITTSS